MIHIDVDADVSLADSQTAHPLYVISRS